MSDLSNSVMASWLLILRRRWKVGLAVFAGVFALAAYQVLNARPVYRADAKIRIGEPPPVSGLGAGSVLGFMRLGGDPFANDLELMNSRTVTEAVVRDAVLTLKVTAPKGRHRDALFSSLRTSDQTKKATYRVRWSAPGSIRITEVAPVKRELGTFAAEQRIELSGVSVAFKQLRAARPEEVVLQVLPFGEAVRRASTRVTVTRKRRDANVAELRVSDGDPGLAQLMVGSVLRRFLELRSSIAQRESGQNVDSLRAVAQQTLAELRAAETDLERLQREKLLVDPAVQSEAFVERYSTVATQLETTRAELQALNAVLERATSVETAAQRWTRLLAYRPFLNNATIGDLLRQLNALEERRAALAPRRTENNREYSLILDQIGYLDRSLSTLAADVRTGLQEQERRLAEQVLSMERALAALPQNSIELARRQRSARVLSEVLVLTEQRLRQEELRQALSFSNVQVIDAPALRFRPVWPRPRLGLVVGWLVAFITALLAIAVAESADRRLRRAADVQSLTGQPVLGVALRTKQGVTLKAGELHALVHHASANGRGPLRVVLAPVGNTDVAAVAAAVSGAFRAPVAAGLGESVLPEVVVSDAIVDFASASAAARSNVPLALVVDERRCTREQLHRAARLIEQAGGKVGGTIVVCRDAARAADLWA